MSGLRPNSEVDLGGGRCLQAHRKDSDAGFIETNHDSSEPRGTLKGIVLTRILGLTGAALIGATGLWCRREGEKIPLDEADVLYARFQSSSLTSS